MSLSWKLIQALPASIRSPLIRQWVRFPSELPSDIRFKVAETKDELEQAFSLLHDAYVKEGLMTPHPSGMRVTKYHALPSTSTLIAIQGGLVVGTLSIVRQNAFGLPLEAIFDLDQLPPGSRPAEVSSLAIRDGFRQQRGRILFPLLKFAHQYAVEYFGVTHFLIAVNPKWFTFYEAILLFKKLTNKTVASYDFVNGAPAVGAYLDLRKALREYVVTFGKNPVERNLCRFFFDLPPLNMEFPLRKRSVISDPVLSPELVEHFFIRKTQVFESLTDFERLVLREMYNTREFLDLIPKSKVIPYWTRQEKRYDVDLRARVVLEDGRVIPLDIHCISDSGLGGTLSVPIPLGKYTIHVDAEDYDACVIHGELHWVSPKRRFGFSIDRGDLSSNTKDALARWSHLVAQIEARLVGKRVQAPQPQQEPEAETIAPLRLTKL